MSGQPKPYEFRDHTADVQIHSWGKTLPEAFAASAVAMFDYMTELDKVDIQPGVESEIDVSAEDMKSLLYTFLEEFIFLFGTEFIVYKKIEILDFDREAFRIRARGYGEEFNKEKHPQGTEIKAITYSAMEIIEEAEKSDIYVIVDI